ncbi:MAG: fumarylacetoacetate hydrolase family protein [Alphaproteobacteria bacterium]|nr:fumarylacetoacetate hydrolase family protein [Alphaproteobacteria bacterium]
MRLVTFMTTEPRIGVVDDETIYDLQELYGSYLFETERTPQFRALAQMSVPQDMALFIRLNHGRLKYFEPVLAYAREKQADLKRRQNVVYELSDTRLLPPILQPSKVIMCGSSYGEYLAMLGRPKSAWPQDVKISFFKSPTSLIGHGEQITFPPDSNEGDYENEMAIIIGRTCSDVTVEEAADCIFGYSIINDGCVRDIPKWCGGLDSPRGKAGDGFAPFGPWIVPAPYLKSDPNNLRFTTTVDGEVRQSGNTSGLLWPVQRMVAITSRYIRLLPGDIVATGSTHGNAHTNGKFLRGGETVRLEIEGIGALENKVAKRTWKAKIEPMPPLA